MDHPEAHQSLNELESFLFVDFLFVESFQVEPELHILKSPSGKKLQDPPIQVLEGSAILVEKFFQFEGEQVWDQKFSANCGVKALEDHVQEAKVPLRNQGNGILG